MKLQGSYYERFVNDMATGVIAFIGTLEPPRICGESWRPVAAPRRPEPKPKADIDPDQCFGWPGAGGAW
jgi:hypothetical protein